MMCPPKVSPRQLLSLSALLAFSIFLPWQPAETARILFAFPLSAPSHNMMFTSLSRELASRGHHITVITTFPIPSPPENYKQIDISHILRMDLISPTSNLKLLQIMINMRSISTKMCLDTYTTPEVQELIRSARIGTGYDMVITSAIFNECTYALSNVFNASLVLMSPAALYSTANFLVGNPSLPSFSPHMFSPFSDRMDFCERLANTAMTVLFQIFHDFFVFPAHEAIAEEIFGDWMTATLSEIQGEVDLVLLNSHFSFLFPQPMVPNLVEVGGMHVKPAKPLPEDLQTFMDDAKDGVIYFSLGSVVKSKDLSESTRDALLGAFGELKQKVLWKWEADTIPGENPNLKLSKWLPQSDILAHPNIKLFITHGGLFSFQETVIRGVPIIGIPVFGDQMLNMNHAVRLGVGLQLNLASMTKESILQAIRTILNDPSYTDNVKRLSSIANDLPQPPMEKAVYWIEYVLRHGGASHLRSSSAYLRWYQLYMVDIAATLILVLAIGLATVTIAVRGLMKLLGVTKKPKVKQN